MHQCPAHEDRRESLIVSEGQGGRVVLHCFAGCDPEAVLRAWGLTWQDLFAPDGDRAVSPRRVLSEVEQARDEVIRHEERARRRRNVHAASWRLADSLRDAERAVHDARMIATEAGQAGCADDPRVWDLLERAAALEFLARWIEDDAQ
jgi:hypothetical protein